MKKVIFSFFGLFLLVLAGCSSNYDTPTINNEPAVSGQVESVVESSVLDEIENVVDEANISEKTIETPSVVEVKTEVAPIIVPEVKVDDTPTVDSNTTDVPVSNDDYYTNVDGEKVHSPVAAPSRPADASARCRDGTYSFSQNRRGTCSHHGGVAEWY